MNKGDLVDAIVKEAKISKASAEKALNTVIDYIIQSIRTLNPILSERPFYDSFPAVSTLQKCSI